MMADKSSVEKLKEQLYSRGAGPNVESTARTPLTARREAPARSAWSGMRSVGKNEPAADAANASAKKETPLDAEPVVLQMTRHPDKKHSTAYYFLWSSFAFFVIAAAVAAWALLGGGNTISPSNIDMQIVAPSLVDSGKSMTIEYIIDNRNTAPLKVADLVIDYPEGTRDPNDTTKALQHGRVTIGDIRSGEQVRETSTAVFFGAEGTQGRITVTLEYQIAGSNAIFVKQADVMFTIGSAPVLLSISSPNEAISGQPFSMDIAVVSNSTTPIQNVAVEARYPFGFSVVSTTPSADVGNTLWRLGTLQPGMTQTIHLTGTLAGADGDQRVIHFLLGSESDPTETSLAVPIQSMPQTITVRKPFISGQITLDNQTGATIAEPLGKTLQGSLVWQNNLTESVSDLTLTLTLTGSALDPSSVTATNGFFDSTKNQIVWTSQQNPSLATVGPGATGNVQFYFSTLQPSSGVLTNPQLTLNLTVNAARQTGATAPEAVSSAAQMIVHLASSVALTAQALHFTGPLNNTGPMPPKVGQQTTYTILWAVKNSSNTIAGAKVSATLPPYVSFIGAGTAGNENISYDSPSRTVTWSLGDVKAGAGYALPLRQATFQVALTPSLSQIGLTPPLTGDVLFSGTDRFAQAQVQSTASSVSTYLRTDSGFQPGMEMIAR